MRFIDNIDYISITEKVHIKFNLQNKFFYFEYKDDTTKLWIFKLFQAFLKNYAVEIVVKNRLIVKIEFDYKKFQSDSWQKYKKKKKEYNKWLCLLPKNDYLNSIEKIYYTQDYFFYCFAYYSTKKNNTWIISEKSNFIANNWQQENDNSKEPYISYFRDYDGVVKTSDIKKLFLYFLFKNKEIISVFKPMFFYDFENKILYTDNEIEKIFIYNNWTIKYGSFLHLIPAKDRYWIIDGVDYTAEFQKSKYKE